MTYTEVQPIALAVLSAIITGGFVLVFVEIGNRKNRENDRHDGIMTPFMHKLSSYFRFISWSHEQLVYPKDINSNENNFKLLVDQMGQYGSKLIMSGGDYTINDFSAKQLYEIAHSINNIWFFHEKMHPCRLKWNGCVSYNGTDFLAKELKVINPEYLGNKLDANLLAKDSGDFYVDVYQPIEYETFRHRAYLNHYTSQTILVSFFFSFVLLMLCLMLFIHLPVVILQIASVCSVLMLISSLLMLAIDIKIWVRREAKRRERKYHRKNN